MPSRELHHLDKAIIHTDGSRGLAVVNLGDQPVRVFVDVKRGSAWNGWRCLDALEAGARWWAERTEEWGGAVRVVVYGQADGRCRVRVEY